MRPDDEATVICLTPIKNEAWILDRFIQCASTWADHIIIADQQSDDGSQAIARSYDNVRLIENDADRYDEAYRQRLLIEAAREIPVAGKRILIALDADEALTANWSTSSEWKHVLEAEPGTVIGFRWVNVLPGLERGWLSADDKWFGFVDDGSAHNGYVAHSPRIPMPPHARRMPLHDIRVLHFQYLDWERMRSKQRWYQAWERLNFPDKRPITIFRQYNHMFGIADSEIDPLQEDWVAAYEDEGIDLHAIEGEDRYRWDEEVLEMLVEHGPEHFRKIDIWDADWQEKARELGREDVGEELADPRTALERLVHLWLRKTQPHASLLPTRGIQKILQLAGW